MRENGIESERLGELSGASAILTSGVGETGKVGRKGQPLSLREAWHGTLGVPESAVRAVLAPPDGSALVSHGWRAAMVTWAPEKSSDGSPESSRRPGVQGPLAHSHGRHPLPPMSLRRGAVNLFFRCKKSYQKNFHLSQRHFRTHSLSCQTH